MFLMYSTVMSYFYNCTKHRSKKRKNSFWKLHGDFYGHLVKRATCESADTHKGGGVTAIENFHVFNVR